MIGKKGYTRRGKCSKAGPGGGRCALKLVWNRGETGGHQIAHHANEKIKLSRAGGNPVGCSPKRGALLRPGESKLQKGL